MQPRDTHSARQTHRVRVGSQAHGLVLEISARTGLSKKAVITMVLDAYVNGPSAKLRNNLRGKCQAIAVNARLEYREAMGGSPRAKRMLAIEQAANEIPALLGEGSDGARVGRVVIMPE